MGAGTSSDVVGALLLGNLFSVGLLCIACLHLFDIPRFCLLGGLTKTMETPIPGEMPAPDGVDLARVGLHAPPKAPLQVGAGPVGGVAPAVGGSFILYLCVFFLFLVSLFVLY